MGFTGKRAAVLRATTLMVSTVGLLQASAALAQQAARPFDESVWVFPEDYPSEATGQAQDGPTKVVASISATGAITDCRVGITSGSPALDRVACPALIRRGAFVPARDASGKAIASIVLVPIAWGIWRNDYKPDAVYSYESVGLEIDENDARLDCFMTRDNTGTKLPQESCDKLAPFLSRARERSGVSGRAMLSAVRNVGPVTDGEFTDLLLSGDKILGEIRAAYTLAPDGGVSDCKTTTTGQLDEVSLRPVAPCGRALSGISRPGSVPRREGVIWRIVMGPVVGMPLRTYDTHFSLISAPGDTSAACSGTSGQEEVRIDDFCRYLHNTADAIRVRQGYTGRMELHYRAGARQGATPPATALPAGEVPNLKYIRRFRVEKNGAVKDCLESYAGSSAPDDGTTKPCETVPLYDRSGTRDKGGVLWAVEDSYYTYRLLPPAP